MASFILVHGAWHGGWCWKKVCEELRAAGHSVLAPDLPGHGEDTTPAAQIDLASYADFVCGLIDSQEEDVVLVGHSLGGLTVTQVAELRPDRLRCVVYLAAFIPEAGGTVDPAEDLVTEVCLAAVRPSEDGTRLQFDPDAARDVFYADCSEEDFQFAHRRLCPEPAGTMRSRSEFSKEGWGRVPRDYIVCTQDRALRPEAQRALAEHCGCRRIHTLDTSHSPFFSAAPELAKLLKQIADS